MTDDTERAKRAFGKWMEPLGLLWWDLTIRYYDEPIEIINRFDWDNDHITVARTLADWRYGTATIDVNVPALKDMSDEEIERVAVHELIHILVNEMREGDIKHEERVVTALTKAIFWIADRNDV